eukprot:GGOE01014409.1.p1 GENE.GGOE01014409.1~~GGOE01014409.1.p1  ORF type:complete len:707 (+),score=214.23 GGOE01014409.1:30-2123(+)
MADGGPSEEKRVKLYLCNDEGQWVDQGTGHVTIAKSPTGRYLIIVHSETENDGSGNPALMLQTTVALNAVYELQGENLVVWEDPFMQQTLALSFQSAVGCSAVAETIKGIQQGQVDTDDESEPDVSLPEPEVTSLSSLQETLAKAASQPLPVRRQFVARMARPGFFEKLFTIFDQCEDLDDVESLHTLFRIFISILLFNDLHLLSIMFDPKCVMKLMGVLEYDPLFGRRLNHRQYLQSIVQFKEAVQLSEALKCKIHETFKVQYFKDCVVPRYLDDATTATLNGVVVGKQTEIIGELCHNDEVMDEISKRLTDGTREEKVQVLRLLQEMQVFAKNLMPQGKAEFLATLCANSILRTVVELMVSADVTVRRLALDVISQATQHEPGVLRGYILDQGLNCPFLTNVVLRLVGDSPDSERVELVEILKQLLESQKQPPQVVERAIVTAPEEMERVLEVFYDTCVPMLLQPLVQEPDAGITSAFHLIDLLSFCVSQHGDFSKGILMRHALIAKVTALLSSPFCTMQLATALVRFLKAAVMTRDEAYCKQLIKANTFQVLISLLAQNQDRYNLLYSTILAIFEVIRRENLKLLIGHLGEAFAVTLLPFSKLESVNGLQRLWQLMKEKDKVAVREALRQTLDDAPPEGEEPLHTEDKDEIAEGSPASVSPIALVAYGEDDDPDMRSTKRRKVASQSPATAMAT